MLGSGLITFIPKYLGSKLSFWYESANPKNDGTLYAGGSTVTSLIDLSGNSSNANGNTQGGGVNPTYTLGVQNGWPALTCPSGGAEMEVTSNSLFNMQSGISVIAVLKASSTVGTNIPIRYGVYAPDGNTWDWAIQINGPTGKASFNGINGSNATQSSGDSTTNINGTPVILMGQFDGTNLKIFVNNSQENSTAKSGTLKSGTNNTLSLMWGPGGNQFVGSVFCFMCIQGASTAQLNLLHRNYLGPKFGIAVS